MFSTGRSGILNFRVFEKFHPFLNSYYHYLNFLDFEISLPCIVLNAKTSKDLSSPLPNPCNLHLYPWNLFLRSLIHFLFIRKTKGEFSSEKFQLKSVGMAVKDEKWESLEGVFPVRRTYKEKVSLIISCFQTLKFKKQNFRKRTKFLNMTESKSNFSPDNFKFLSVIRSFPLNARSLHSLQEKHHWRSFKMEEKNLFWRVKLDF